MGADIKLEGRLAVIKGVKRLTGQLLQPGLKRRSCFGSCGAGS